MQLINYSGDFFLYFRPFTDRCAMTAQTRDRNIKIDNWSAMDMKMPFD